MKNPYYVLGLKEDCTYQEVKKAYRELSKKTHPDKGGSSEEFNEVNKAFEILSDPIKRKIYDDMGGVDDSKVTQSIYNDIHRLFFNIINANPNLSKINVISRILQDIDKEIMDAKNKVKGINDSIMQIMRLKGKVKLKSEYSKNDNIFDDLIDGKINGLKEEKKFWIKAPEEMEKLKLVVQQYE